MNEFEREMLESLEEALKGTGIKPSYVYDQLLPIIKKYTSCDYYWKQEEHRTTVDI